MSASPEVTAAAAAAAAAAASAAAANGGSSSSSSQHYSLRWNNHQTHVLSAFDALLQSESLVDCTLVCEDASVKAHRVGLSACSPDSAKIFTESAAASSDHPVVVLKDVRAWEAHCIVDFMYRGETSVPEAQVNRRNSTTS